MLYHNLVNRISELPELKVKIATLINQIQEIEQLDKLFFANGKWQQKEISSDEQKLVENLKDQLATYYTLLEQARLDHSIPEQLLNIGERQVLKEVIADVRGGKETAADVSAKLLGVINAITKKSDISLAKLVEETNKDKELSLIRQAIIDGEMDHIPTHYRQKKNYLSVEFGLVFLDEMVVIPDRMQEWILQVAHGDHESSDKMREICHRVYWETKNEDISAKANNCLTCFRSGKNLKNILPKTEKDVLPKCKTVGEQIQIDFAGPFTNEKGKKRYIALAIDNFSRWPFAIVCESCNTDSALKLLAIICEIIGLPKCLKVDNATAFKSRKF